MGKKKYQPSNARPPQLPPAPKTPGTYSSPAATSGAATASRALESERDTSKKQLEETQLQKEILEEQLKDRQEEVMQLIRQLQEAGGRVTELEQSLKSAVADREHQLGESRQQVKALQQELLETKRPTNLRHVISQLEAKKSQLEADIRAAETQCTTLLAEWDQLKDQRDNLFRREGETTTREHAVLAREGEQSRRQVDQDRRHQQLEVRDKRILDQEQELRTRIQQADDRAGELERKRLEQDRRERALKQDLEALDQQRQSFDQEQTSSQSRLLTWEGGLRTLELGLKERELNAEAGFVVQQREAIATLEEEAASLHTHLSATRAQIAEERAAWARELEETRDALEEERGDLEAARAEGVEAFAAAREALHLELDGARREAEVRLSHDLESRREEAGAEARALLDQGRRTLEQEWQAVHGERATLVQERRAMADERRKLEVDQECFEEDTESVELKVQRKAAGEVDRLQAELVAENSRLESTRQARDELQRRLDAREEADRRFGHKSPDEILAELKKLRKDKDTLQDKLAQRMSEADSVRLQALEQQAIDWETERSELRRSLAEARGHLESNRAAVTEQEGLRKHREALEASNKLLQSAIDELQVRVHDLTTKSEGQPVFPTCYSMDSDVRRQESPGELSSIGKDPSDAHRQPDYKDLKEFTGWIQTRMADGSLKSGKLSYSLRDLRLFIGGLAMSRLHLLQGISGTGKTSLPAAFAEAIGAGRSILPVQAGWRDRQDLLGHYNAFERRFLETRFLQALYEASTPQWREQPYLIVLDELNLSRPEQYFADFISIFEQPEGERRIELMSQSIDPAPKGLEDGRFLRLPKNVWFIGTANKDETTLEIADKTYDRSHVMELPRHREKVDASEKAPLREPLGLVGLERAFNKAQRDHAEKADKALDWLEKFLREPLYRLFRVGWGNRLERQARAFVPVIKAAGGSAGEAVDHLLATRLLRRICDRHDVRVESYRALGDTLRNAWKQLEDNNGQPFHSLALIEDQLNQLSFDRVDEEAE